MSRNFAGMLSLFGTLAVILFIGVQYGDASSLWGDVVLFLTGRGAEIERVPRGDAATFLSGSLFMASLSVIVAVAAALSVRFFIGEARGKPSAFTNKPRKDLKFFRALFLIVLLEEIFARWLFLGVLRQVPALSGPIGLYILFFLGNGIWALLHLSNYFFEEDKRPIRVLPQFVSGVLETVVFLKWGLVGAVLVHFTHNAVVFAASKREEVGAGWFVHAAVHALMLFIAMIGMEKPLADVGAWLGQGTLEPIAGWSLGDYAWLLIFVSSAVSLASTVLLYDQMRSKENPLHKHGFIKGSIATLVVLALVAVIVPVLSYVAYWCVGLVVDDMTSRIAGACLLIALFGSTSSMSRAMRAYWSTITYSFLFLCVVATLGIGPAIQITFYVGLATVPATLLLLSVPVGREEPDPSELAAALVSHLTRRRR